MATKTIIQLGLFIAIATVLHILETWLPPIAPLPGAKLGLANIVTLITLILWGWKNALLVTISRVLLSALLGGSLFGPAFVMSIAGALASLTIMNFSMRHFSQRFSLVGISVLGAFTHSVFQVLVASLLVSDIALFWYLPWLMVVSVPAGIGAGLCALFFLRHSKILSRS